MATFDPDSRYRITRNAFDVISVFPSLGAKAVPGPVFVEVLGLHGHSASAVKNRLVRMVDQGQLVRTRVGTTSLYQISPVLEHRYREMQSGPAVPEWSGRFHAVVHGIREAERGARDRLVYTARFDGYRQLRPGVLISFAERTEYLRGRLGPILSGSLEDWADLCWMTPQDAATAERWVRRAFLDEDVPGRVAELTARVDAFVPGEFSATLSTYMDLLYEVIGIFQELPVLPAEFSALCDSGPRLGALLGRLHGIFFEYCAPTVMARVQASPAAALIRWEQPLPVTGQPVEAAR